MHTHTTEFGCSVLTPYSVLGMVCDPPLALALSYPRLLDHPPTQDKKDTDLTGRNRQHLKTTDG